MKKLTKKVAQELIHRVVPGVKVEVDTSRGCIGAYIAHTPEMQITCWYNHFQPKERIRLGLYTSAPRSITMLYDPETLERDYNAEYDDDKEAWREEWEVQREIWEAQRNRKNH